MRLEAIAALLGHRKMEMTLIYARIANRVVADEYAAVSAKIDALYGQPPELPADYETTGMARLRREAHARMLGNGLCTRPAELDCRMESACETCAYFQTSTEFLPILTRQRDHARDHGQSRPSRPVRRPHQRAGHPGRHARTDDGADDHAPGSGLAATDAAELTETAQLPHRLATDSRPQPIARPSRRCAASPATPPTTPQHSAPTWRASLFLLGGDERRSPLRRADP